MDVTSMNPWELRVAAEQAIQEDRVARDDLISLVLEGDSSMDEEWVNGFDAVELIAEAARVVGEDRVATDRLAELLESMPGDEDAGEQ